MLYVFLNLLSCFIPIILLSPVIYFMVLILESDNKIWLKIISIVMSFVLCRFVFVLVNIFFEGVVLYVK